MKSSPVVVVVLLSEGLSIQPKLDLASMNSSRSIDHQHLLNGNHQHQHENHDDRKNQHYTIITSIRGNRVGYSNLFHF